VFNLDAGRKETLPDHVRFHGRGAQAFFDSGSECVFTSVQIQASLGSFKEGSGAPSRDPAAEVFIDRYDYCTETFLSSIHGLSTDGVALQVDNPLTAASLQVTIPGVDFVTGADVVVQVDLDWTSTGTLLKTSGKTREVILGGMLITHFIGTRRGATASGTVSLDGVNLTPDPTGSAFIFNAKSSEQTVEHTRQ
jgi:hypothetical protein